MLQQMVWFYPWLYLFLRLSSTLLWICTISLASHLFLGIWVVSIIWPMYIMLQWTYENRYISPFKKIKQCIWITPILCCYGYRYCTDQTDWKSHRVVTVRYFCSCSSFQGPWICFFFSVQSLLFLIKWGPYSVVLEESTRAVASNAVLEVR